MLVGWDFSPEDVSDLLEKLNRLTSLFNSREVGLEEWINRGLAVGLLEKLISILRDLADLFFLRGSARDWLVIQRIRLLIQFIEEILRRR